jgi:hypothetical protein
VIRSVWDSCNDDELLLQMQQGIQALKADGRGYSALVSLFLSPNRRSLVCVAKGIDLASAMKKVPATVTALVDARNPLSVLPLRDVDEITIGERYKGMDNTGDGLGFSISCGFQQTLDLLFTTTADWDVWVHGLLKLVQRLRTETDTVAYVHRLGVRTQTAIQERKSN